MKHTLRGSDRAISSPLGYVLNLAIAGLVLVSISAVGLVFFDASDTAAVEEDLTTVGNDLAGEIQAVDRLAREESTREVGERSALPITVRGERYTIEVLDTSHATDPAGSQDTRYAEVCDRACLVLVTQDGETQATVNFVSETPVERTSIDGGPVYVHRPADSDRIEFEPVDSPDSAATDDHEPGRGSTERQPDT